MSVASSIVQVIRAHAARQPGKPAFVLLAEGETELIRATYGELDQLARSLAARLQAAGLAGERVLLPMSTSLEYVTGMLGCFYAGAVPVPAYPPGGRQHAERLRAVVADCGARIALSTTAKAGALRARFAQFGVGDLDILTIDEAALPDQVWTQPDLAPGALAYLQYTSGSTGDPRGVMVTQRSLLRQCSLFTEAMTLTERDVNVSWLPLFHDFGLIAGALNSLYLGQTTVLIPPVTFAQRPARWLDAITRYHGTSSWAPNFALDLCCDRIDARSRAGLDLSRWRVLGTGAEPVRADTLDRFGAEFAGSGFRPQAFAPGYGLAEATLALAVHQPGGLPAIRSVSADSLGHGSLRDATKGERIHRLVGNGPAWQDTELLVVDPDGAVPCLDGAEGEVWVRGETVAAGYWMRPAETEANFRAYLADGRGPFLRTGDLGVLADGELYITGRRKDLIIIRGRNVYPHDVELTAARSHRALEPDRGVAFSIEEGGHERLVIVHELRRSQVDGADPDEIARAIAQAVTEEHEAEVSVIVLLPSATLPLTSSGKVRRQRCKEIYQRGELPAVRTWRAPAGAAKPAAEPVAWEESEHLAARYDVIAGWLTSRIAGQLGLPAADLDAAAPFGSLGLDSVTLAGITADLGEALGQPIAPTLPYEHPTIARLARALSGGPGPPVTLHRAAPAGDPVAVIGMACRFPGANSPAEYWDLLLAGRDAITEVPGSRWPADRYYRPGAPLPGHATTRWGGFIAGEYLFDAGFFGISAQEARSMDPQQRLLLTTTLRALEDSGTDVSSLAGSDTGVFVGISSNDYGRLQARDGAGLDAYSGTGNALSVAANRISFFFDLHGPSLAVDTACSSSLVAVHQAVTALGRGECGLAIVAGVNLLLAPDLTVVFSQAGMMAPDGRCKVFDTSADGYVRGEGCGVVVLKGHAAAREDGDKIYAMVRGSAVNSGGQAPSLTAPNGAAQEAVLRQALVSAGLPPDRVGYVEAHGTGTALGDPVEVAALGRVYGTTEAGDPDPLWIGSVKASIGHLEAAAGIAGLIKAVLVLGRGVIPPQANFRDLNPRISLDGSRCRIAARVHSWVTSGHPRTAGVSSFGFGGTNAHVILEEATAPPPAHDAHNAHNPFAASGWELLGLSAKQPSALRRLAEDWAGFLSDSPAEPFAAICDAAGARRAHYPHRMAVVARSATEAAALLRDRGEEPAGISSGVAGRHRGHPVAFVFTGQGAQYPGMAGRLYERHAVFREVLDRCEQIIAATAGMSLLPALRDAAVGSVDLGQTRFAQPALFAVEYAMAAMWRACGVEPDYVLGHSLGEYVAACVAGVLTEQDALRLLLRRAELMQDHSAPAAMFAAQAPADLLAGLCAEFRAASPDDVAIAAVNSPVDVTLSGESGAVTDVARSWGARGAHVTRLAVNRAFHSPLMARAAAMFEPAARSVEYGRPRIGFVTNLTGELAGMSVVWEDYWTRQFVEPARFWDAMRSLHKAGCRTYVELGPHPVLAPFGSACVPGAPWLATLHRDDADDRRFIVSLGQYYAHGGTLDWAGLRRGRGGTPPAPVSVPGHPLTEKEYRYVAGQPSADGAHPLLGTDMRLAAPGHWFGHTLRADRPWFTAHHRVAGMPVLPAAAMLEWALAAVRAAGVPGPAWTLEHVSFNEPLVLTSERETDVQAVVDRDRRVRCFGREVGHPEREWTEHLTVATARSAPASPQSAPPSGEESLPRPVEILNPADLYQRLAAAGLEYGAGLRALKELRRYGDTAQAQVQAELPGDDDYMLHPVVLDAAFHAAAGFVPPDGSLWVPAAVDRLTAFGRLPGSVRCDVRWRGAQPSGDQVFDLDLRGDDGALLASLTALRLRKVAAHAFDAAAKPSPRRYEVTWRQVPGRAAGGTWPDGTWLVFSSDPGVLREWTSLGERVLGVLSGQRGTGEIDLTDRAQVTRLFERLNEEQGRIAGVVLHASGAGGGPAPDVPRRAYDLLRQAVPLVQHMVTQNATALILCSSGAAYVGVDGDPEPDPAQSPLTGLITAVAAEFPQLRCVQVDLDQCAPAAPEAILAQAATVARAGHLAQRGGAWYQARVLADELPASAGPAVVVRPDVTYLVTGGWGGLGLVIARWLADHGARSLLLAGRVLPEREPEALAELKASGVRVELLAADVATDPGIARIAGTLAGLPPLRGIIHAAGVTSDAPLGELSWPDFTRVLDAKVRGAWHLHRLTNGRTVDMFVLFSSVAALVGSPGQANYVAANAFLDGLARYRRHQGLPAVSIAWGPWAETGMARHRGLLSRMARSGMHPLTTREALSAFDGLLAGAPPSCAPPYVAVAKIDWPGFLAGGTASYPELDRPVQEAAGKTGAGEAAPAEHIASLLAAEPEAATEAVLALMLNRVANLVSLDPAQRAELRPSFGQLRLNEMGIDSLMAVQLRNWLLSTLSADVPPHYLLGGSTVADVAELVCQQIAVRSLVATEADESAVGTEALTI